MSDAMNVAPQRLIRPQKCRGCNTWVWWLVNDTTGKKAPIEIEIPRDGKGNVVVNLADETYRVLSPERVGILGVVNGLRRNHFISCPKAEVFRRP